MNVTFTRTGERRYRVSVEGPGIESSYMEPAPGFDARLPHDAAHFIVENELGINGGVFGQLAAGGHAGTFRSDGRKKPRRAAKRGDAMSKANRDDALFSEHAVYVACSEWNGDPEPPSTKIPSADIKKICSEFKAFCEKWSNLSIGGSVTLAWKVGGKPKQRR